MKLRRHPGEQADTMARRYFGRPLGDDPEAADALRYFFEHQLGYPAGLLPDTVSELELPAVPELFRIFQQRSLGERPTGAWTRRRRLNPGPKKPLG